MSFELQSVVPWGRNKSEYTHMFNLSEQDLNRKIISFGDGPASFNSQMNSLQKRITSIDPIYEFTKNEIQNRIIETKDMVIKQAIQNMELFIWDYIKNPEELENIRMESMNNFLLDFELGKIEKRYIPHSLPDKTEFLNQEFEIGLSSHFLFLYSQLGIDFHIQSITEMLRICKEVRIFPIIDLNSNITDVFNTVFEYFSTQYNLEITSTNYNFQKGGNQMLHITKKVSTEK